MLSRLEVLVIAYASLILAKIDNGAIVDTLFGILFTVIYLVMLFKDMDYVGRKRT